MSRKCSVCGCWLSRFGGLTRCAPCDRLDDRERAVRKVITIYTQPTQHDCFGDYLDSLGEALDALVRADRKAVPNIEQAFSSG